MSPQSLIVSRAISDTRSQACFSIGSLSVLINDVDVRDDYRTHIQTLINIKQTLHVVFVLMSRLHASNVNCCVNKNLSFCLPTHKHTKIGSQTSITHSGIAFNGITTDHIAFYGLNVYTEACVYSKLVVLINTLTVNLGYAAVRLITKKYSLVYYQCWVQVHKFV